MSGEIIGVNEEPSLVITTEHVACNCYISRVSSKVREPILPDDLDYFCEQTDSEKSYLYMSNDMSTITSTDLTIVSIPRVEHVSEGPEKKFPVAEVKQVMKNLTDNEIKSVLFDKGWEDDLDCLLEQIACEFLDITYYLYDPEKDTDDEITEEIPTENIDGSEGLTGEGSDITGPGDTEDIDWG